MAPIDIIILVIFVASAAYGWWRGMIVQIGSLAGILLGILLCRLFGEGFADFLIDTFGGDGPISSDTRYATGVAANVILFILGFIAAKLVAHVIKAVTQAVRLSLIDKLCGVIFSIFEWFLIFSILLNVWQAFRPSDPILKNSSLGNGRAAHAILNLAPNVLGNETIKSIFD
ncbi:MAG: CvpA family protein [Bacteroidales bacterium]|nr:CvpA family protein [Bacteroidales bacterium]MDE6801653.1 CvpA family protein [Muribaculaceae bacterium]MDE6831644.1 CvpA family protein [Muribaculaceae bacterium]